MPRLIVMRHGNTFEKGQTPVQIGAKTDLPLTAQGHAQAREAALYFQKTPIKALFSGPLQRHLQTAAAFPLKAQIEPALNEIDYGPWEGLNAAEIALKYPTESAAWHEKGLWQPLFGSRLETHQHALNQWLAKLRPFAPEDTFLAVSSNGLLRLLNRGEKVQTGHFCEFFLHPDRLEILSWNQSPLALK